MTLTLEPPLFRPRPSSDWEQLKAPTYLNDPIYQHELKGGTSWTIQLFALLSELEMHLNQDLPWESLWNEIQTHITPKRQLADILLKHQWHTIFPLSSLQAGSTQTLTSSGSSDYRSYLKQITQLNQVMGMAQQLRNDISLKNHKYIAHQLALLYQCLTMSGSTFYPFKARIEEHFDQVKTSANSSSEPQLPEELKVWLHALTSDLLQTIGSLPQGLAGPHVGAIAESLHQAM